MTNSEFKKLVARGIDELRPDILARMENVAIVIADEPTLKQRHENGIEVGGVLFGLYEGVPLIERDRGEFMLPDKITIFKKPILEVYSSPKDIATCVSNTVWHEVAHHFGLDEDEVEAEERRRGKTL